jgi:hypothetical protein
MMLRITIQQIGWRYSGGKEMFRSFMEAIIHPYQGSYLLSKLTIRGPEGSGNHSQHDVLS